MHTIQNGTPNGAHATRIGHAVHVPLNNICRGWRKTVRETRDSPHVAVATRGTGRSRKAVTSRCVFLGTCWSLHRLHCLHRLVYFDALLGCWRQREGDGLRREDGDLLVAVMVSADLTPA